MNRILIIGGVAGGASVAARLRRLDEQAEIILIEKGPYISYANCGLPYYLGNTIPQREKLFVQDPAVFALRFRIDIRTRSEATRIFPEKKTVIIRNLENGESYEERYDKLVLSPGASPIVPELPGIHSKGIFTLRDVQDTDIIKQYIMEHDVGCAVIVGGGFIGLEMAENLTMAGMEVHLVEKSNQVMAPLDPEMANFIHQKLYDNGICLHLGCSIKAFDTEDEVIRVQLNNGEEIPANMVMLCMGVRPNTELAKTAGLEIGSLGGISVDGFMQTSDPDIYALGDAVEHCVKPVPFDDKIIYIALQSPGKHVERFGKVLRFEAALYLGARGKIAARHAERRFGNALDGLRYRAYDQHRRDERQQQRGDHYDAEGFRY